MCKSDVDTWWSGSDFEDPDTHPADIVWLDADTVWGLLGIDPNSAPKRPIVHLGEFKDRAKEDAKADGLKYSSVLERHASSMGFSYYRSLQAEAARQKVIIEDGLHSISRAGAAVASNQPDGIYRVKVFS